MRTSCRLDLVAAALVASVALPAVLSSPPARADLGEVIRSIPCAGPNTGDLAWVGGIFIAITLGVLFSGVFLASLSAFIERIASWSNFFASF